MSNDTKNKIEKNNIRRFVETYGVEASLEILLECIQERIDHVNIFGVEDFALTELKDTMLDALDHYKFNNNEFKKRNE